MNFVIRELVFNSADYQLELKLRHKVMREPLGLEFTAEELRLDEDSWHIGAFESAKLCGCLLLSSVNDTEIKMRQVAVDSRLQKSGIGSKLVQFAEQFARDKHFTKIVLSARDVAVPFYTKHGYEVSGTPFMQVGLPHRHMFKIIS